MEEPKKHFKMYKSGKRWVIAAVITTAAQACLLVPHIAHADTAGLLLQSLQLLPKYAY